MALRNQPYIPLYVQDFMTDEKLLNCSAIATGVYIRLMCLMHKSSQYGKILLKQKDKQNPSKLLDFASKVAKSMPYQVEVVHEALAELVDEEVLQIEGDELIQKRMVNDCLLSEKRANAGKKGGITKSQTSKFCYSKTPSKIVANTEYEYENENTNNIYNGIAKTKNPLDVEYPIEKCKEIALKDQRWCEKNKITPKDLDEFNAWLEKGGVYQHHVGEYKTYYRNWRNSKKKHIEPSKPLKPFSHV